VSETAAYLAKGIVLGLSVAAPLGPIGVLCLRRTLAHGFLAGLAGGAGTALADALYALVAAFGVTAVSAFLAERDVLLRLVGGGTLLWLALDAWRARPAAEARERPAGGRAAAFAQTFVLTMANPMTALSFAALFAGLGLAGAGGRPASAWALVGGVFAGSLLWWAILSGAAAAVRERITSGRLRWVNRLSALLLAGFALYVLADLG
jgi:putative LysE/RhtB family amino acid efflux pump